MATAFHQNPRYAFLGQRVERRQGVEITSLVTAAFHHLHAAVVIGLTPRLITVGAGHDPSREQFRIAHQTAGQGQAQPGIHHHAHRRALSQPWQPAGEVGVIRLYRAAAHHHRVMAQAQAVHSLARCLAGNPAALSVTGSDTPVQGGGQLQRHQRAAFLDPHEETGIDCFPLFCAQPHIDGDPGLFQGGDAFSRDPGVGVLQRHHGA